MSVGVCVYIEICWVLPPYSNSLYNRLYYGPLYGYIYIYIYIHIVNISYITQLLLSGGSIQHLSI